MVGAPVELSAMLPIARNASGRPRNKPPNRKNGTRPSHDPGLNRRAGRAGGTPPSSTPDASAVTFGPSAGWDGRYLTSAPTTASHCLVMSSFALAASAEVG